MHLTSWIRGGPELFSSWIWSSSNTADCSCACLLPSSLCQMGWTGVPKSPSHGGCALLTPCPASSILLFSCRGSGTLPMALGT